MTGTVAQFVRLLDRLAPAKSAETWDNVGLQVGSRDWPVRKIWTALDPLPAIVAEACENDVDLLVTHHPLIFKPISAIDGDTPLGRIVQLAFSHQLAIFSAHTNLDSVAGGVNDVLAGRIGLRAVRVLSPAAASAALCKLVLYVPAMHVKAILDTLFDLDIEGIGSPSCRTFRCDGVGTLCPETEDSSTGRGGPFSEIQESRIETCVNPGDLDRIIDAVKTLHPIASMSYDVHPLGDHRQQTGLGRVGELPSAMPLDDLARHLKTVLRIPAVKVAGPPQGEVSRVAVCSGSGASLLPAAIGSGAQAYISGDLGHHTAIDAVQAGLSLIDVGHFASEHLIVEVLANTLREASLTEGLAVTVAAFETESDPFHYL